MPTPGSATTDDLNLNILEAVFDATLLTVGVLAEALIRNQAIDREWLIGSLNRLAVSRIDNAPQDDLPAQFAAEVVRRLAVTLEEGLTFLPNPPRSGQI